MNCLTLPHAKAYLNSLIATGYASSTVDDYKIHLTTLQLYMQAHDLTFEQLDKTVIDSFKYYLLKEAQRYRSSRKGVSEGHTNKTLIVLRQYLIYLIDVDYPVPIIPNKIKLVKTPKRVVQELDLNDLVKLVEAPESLETNQHRRYRNRAILEVLFSAGLRISELVALDRSAFKDGATKFKIQGKGKKERWAWLTPRAAHYLERYLSIRKDRLTALFISRMHKRISAKTIERFVIGYGEKLDLKIKITPHTLRHGFISALAQEGIDVTRIRDLVGHTNIATTSLYLHTTEQRLEEAVEAHPFAKLTRLPKPVETGRGRGRPKKRRGRPPKLP